MQRTIEEGLEAGWNVKVRQAASHGKRGGCVRIFLTT